MDEAKDGTIGPHAATLVGIFVALALFALAIAAQIVYYRLEQREHQKKFVDRGSPKAAAVLTEQRKALTEYRWVDQDRGRVRIPVQRAMLLVTERISRSQKPASVEVGGMRQTSEEGE